MEFFKNPLLCWWQKLFQLEILTNFLHQTPRPGSGLTKGLDPDSLIQWTRIRHTYIYNISLALPKFLKAWKKSLPCQISRVSLCRLCVDLWHPAGKERGSLWPPRTPHFQLLWPSRSGPFEKYRIPLFTGVPFKAIRVSGFGTFNPKASDTGLPRFP